MRLIDADALIDAMTGACNIFDAHGIDTTISRLLIKIAKEAPTKEAPTVGDDLIRRQAALDALKDVEWFTVMAERNTTPPYFVGDDVTSINIHMDTDAVKRAIEAVPSAFDKDNMNSERR